MSQPVIPKEIGLTAHEWEIADAQAVSAGMSRGQWFGWVVLSQLYDADEVADHMALRRGRGRVWAKKGKQK